MSSHFLAGTGLGSVVLSFSLFATAFSGYTLLGVPGSAYRDGYGAFVWVHTAVTVTTTQLFVAPRLYRLARLRGYITPCCYIRERYNNVYVTSFVTGCYLVPMAIYVLAQIKSMSTLMGSLTGSEQVAFASTGALTAIMLLYESLGGLKSVAWTDVAQGVLLLSGFFCMFGIAQVEFGGLAVAGHAMRDFDAELTEVPSGWKRFEWLSIGLAIGGPLQPVWLHRLFAARRARDIRIAYTVLAWAPLLATLPSAVVGWAAKAHLPNLGDECSDQVFGRVNQRVMGIGLGGEAVVSVLVAAVVAALMSTADSALMCFSSIFTLDIVKPRLLKRFASRAPHAVGVIQGAVATQAAAIVPGSTIAQGEAITQWGAFSQGGTVGREKASDVSLASFLAQGTAPEAQPASALRAEPPRFDATLLKISKLCSLGVCLCGLGLAHLPVTLEALSRLQAQLSLQVSPLFFFGLLTSLPASAALLAISSGSISTLLLFVLDLSGIFPLHNIDAGTYGLLINVSGALVGWALAARRRRGASLFAGLRGCVFPTRWGTLHVTSRRGLTRVDNRAAVAPAASAMSQPPRSPILATAGAAPPTLATAGAAPPVTMSRRPSTASTACSASSSESGASAENASVHPHTLALAGLKEPIQHPGYCALTLLVMVCGCPFYRSAGVQDELVGGIPVWMYVSLGFSVLLAGLNSFGHLFLWHDEFSDSHAAALKDQAVSSLEASQAQTCSKQGVKLESGSQGLGEAPSEACREQLGGSEHILCHQLMSR